LKRLSVLDSICLNQFSTPISYNIRIFSKSPT
jgi:hypothetical protein